MPRYVSISALQERVPIIEMFYQNSRLLVPTLHTLTPILGRHCPSRKTVAGF